MRMNALLLVSLAAACHSSTSPTHNHNPALDSISMNGSWTGVDSVRDTVMLFLTQTGDSVHGTGSVAYVPVRVIGSNLSPQHCSGGACEVPLEVVLQLTDANNDTLVLGGGFAQDTDQVRFMGSEGGPAPGFPFVFASLDTMTITRSVVQLDR